MYFVKYGQSYLHDPRNSDYILLDLSITANENSCGYCDFTIYPNHPMYSKIKERDAANPIEVYDDDTLLFAGFIYELGVEFYLDGHVKCKGELEYLRESILRPYSTKQRSFGLKAPESINGYFDWLIEQHNAQVDVSKQFTVGINQGSSLSTLNMMSSDNDKYPTENNKYPTILDELKEKLIDNEDIGGYIRIRHENNIRYIDYLAEWSKTNSQILDFGVNLTNYTQTDDSENIATFVVPLGADLGSTDYEHDDGYRETEDTERDRTKTYYTQHTNYDYCGYITEFKEGVTYYEKGATQKYAVTTDKTPNPTKRYYKLVTPAAGTTVDDTYVETNGTYGYVSTFENGYTYYEKNRGGDTYVVTTDTVPLSTKLYYTQRISYTAISDEVISFEEDVTYYEYFKEYDESVLSLTLEGMGDGSCEDTDYKKIGDMIFCESATKKYGWVGLKFEDSTIKDREKLRDAGVIALKEKVSPKRTIEIKAVDMHLINPSIKPIMVGEYVRVRSKPHNLDSYFLCRNINLDMNNPENSLYTLGDTFDTLTGIQNKRINELNDAINKTYEAADSIVGGIKKDVNVVAKSASAAVATSTAAITAANAATTKADLVDQKVTGIQSSVSLAQSAAESAQTSAEEAKSALTTAQTTAASAVSSANSANTSAAEALAAATQAQTDASAASTTASAAKAEAEQATSDISSVRTDLSGQIETLSNTMTADYAKKTDVSSVEGTLRSEISQSASDITSAVAQTYSKKTDLTSVESSLQTLINQNAEAISSHATSITTINTAVNNAKKTADDASSAAATAQSTADTAKSNAATAQSKANEAATAASTAQKAADDAKANLKTAQDNLTAVQAQANATDEQVAAAKKAVATAQKAADDAQADATAAATAASTAQSTADTAKANAATAQTAANNAKKAADDAQAGVNSLGTRMTSAETTISQNSQQIALRATKTEVQTSIDNIQIGGRNLYLGTRDFDGDNWINLDEWETWDKDGFPYKEYGRHGAWQGIHQEVEVTAGKQYTFSAWVRGDETAELCFFTDWDSTTTTPDNVTLGHPTSEYVRYSVTVTANISGTIWPRIENSDDDTWIQICGIKFEEGNKATDWCPAPEDAENYISAIDARVSTAETSITQHAEAIALRATKTEVTSAVNGIQVGGKNLLVRSKSKRNSTPSTGSGITISAIDDNGWITVSGTTTGGGSARAFTLWGEATNAANNDLPHEAGEYTLSVEATDGTFVQGSSWTNSTHIALYYETSNKRVAGFNPNTISFSITSHIYRVAYYIGADIPDGTVINGKFRLKLEKGNKATDWTPAPEDLATSKAVSELSVTASSIASRVTSMEGTVSEIEQTSNGVDMRLTGVEGSVSNASKSATNYLSFSDQGVIIGNLRDALDLSNDGWTDLRGAKWVGMTDKTWSDIRGAKWSSFLESSVKTDVLKKNVQIDEDSVNIRNGETVLASFSENGIGFTSPVAFTADGILVDNGDAYSNLGRNNILWSSVNGWWMNASQSISLSANISRQLTGVVFAWCQYNTSTSATLNQNWKYFFVPKAHVLNRGGDAVIMSDPYLGLKKQIYISNGVVSGHADNVTSGTTNSIAWDNRNYTLRYIIGV